MAASEELVYTRIGENAAGENVGFYLELGGDGGQEYDLVQLNMVYALNEIPTAKCLLGTGRPYGAKRPGISQNAGGLDQFKTMAKAKVWMQLSGEFKPGSKWPEAKQCIFDGYLAGSSIDGSQDRMFASVDLVHWSIDLTFSSCLVAGLMPASAGCLSNPLLLNQLSQGTGTRGTYTTVEGMGAAVGGASLAADLWGSIKNLYALLSRQNIQLADLQAQDRRSGKLAANSRAQNALKRIEGPAVGVPTLKLDYKYGVALALDPTLSSYSGIENAISRAISQQAALSYLGSSFWEKAVQEILPMFGLAFAPMVSRAIVIADTPLYSSKAWRTLTTGEYSEIRQPRELLKPIRGVAVLTPGAAGFPGTMLQTGEPGFRTIGGYYTANSVSVDDGHVLFVPPPPWMSLVSDPFYSLLAGDGRIGSGPSKFVGGAATIVAAGVLGDLAQNRVTQVQTLYGRWAKHVFAQNSMRGSTGLIVGKLRFDIAPGSGIILQKKAETFLGTADGLSGELWANVNRVSYAVDVENRIAATTLQLSYVRTAAENATDRGGVKESPLFGKSIHGKGAHGAPLIEGHELL